MIFFAIFFSILASCLSFAAFLLVVGLARIVTSERKAREQAETRLKDLTVFLVRAGTFDRTKRDASSFSEEIQ